MSAGASSTSTPDGYICGECGQRVPLGLWHSCSRATITPSYTERIAAALERIAAALERQLETQTEHPAP